MVEIKLNGFDESVEKLLKLPQDLRKRALVRAMSRATRIVTKAAKANALRVDDSHTGRRIANNVQQRFASRTYKRTGDVMYRVGVATPKGRIPKGNPDEGAKGPTPHWHLVELGTENMRAEPFMLPALTSNIGAVIDKAAAELAASLKEMGA
ncbi:HK97-gp10 family putative phage morphogenesis protein [Variovorax sp. UMC13]|uniref:HK97-gp10 family putative phage morphogenesis protein n=1 Tax=Variovorax sp. UMC13 TaxID=1862326 RepID=UPI00160041E9|nr:HK97-gp10 family putative phage morphogenesis protein [Variovorax sp. UMC13]MBB1603316.1 hypothetical protein [Variovorax sp. UMC13]